MSQWAMCVDPLIGGFHSNKIVGRALSNQPTPKFKVSKVKECVSRFDKQPRRSSCIYSTLSKAFTMISKVFQSGRRRQRVLPPSSSLDKKPLPNNLITPSLTFALSSQSSSFQNRYIIDSIPWEFSSVRLYKYFGGNMGRVFHWYFISRDCPEPTQCCRAQIWGVYFSQI